MQSILLKICKTARVLLPAKRSILHEKEVPIRLLFQANTIVDANMFYNNTMVPTILQTPVMTTLNETLDELMNVTNYQSQRPRQKDILSSWLKMLYVPR